MNPLKHFGIQKQFIRGDTKSYNDRNAYRQRIDDEVRGLDMYIDSGAPLDEKEEARYAELRNIQARDYARDARNKARQHR